MDSATEFLFGKAVDSISAGLPYPAGSPLGDNLHFVNHPSNAFVKAFAEAQVHNMIRVKSGASWPLREIFGDKVKPLRKVLDDFIQPLLSEGYERKAKGVKSVESEKKPDDMTLLDRLVEEADGKHHFTFEILLANFNLLADPKVVQDELVNVLVAGRDSVSSSDGALE